MVEKVENIRGGESGVMCCKLTEAENVERIFSVFSVKNSTNLSVKTVCSFFVRVHLYCRNFVP